jgi:MFS family permease
MIRHFSEPIKRWRSFSTPVQTVLLSFLGVALGFYMLIPFLSQYMNNDLKLTAKVIGLILGLRVLTQQGMSFLGGLLSDRLGDKRIIVWGLVVRSTGMFLFGFSAELWGLIGASLLVGFGGAMVGPNVRSFLSRHCNLDEREEAFAFFNIFASVGMFLGPLIGFLLVNVSFSILALATALMYVLLAVACYFVLPDANAILAKGANYSASVAPPSIWGGIQEVFSNSGFLWFCLNMMGYSFVFQQIYLVFPIELERLTETHWAATQFFLILSLTSIFFQYPITVWSKRKWIPRVTIHHGFWLLGSGCLLPVLSSGFDSYYAQASVPKLLLVMPYFIAAFLLSCGFDLIQPVWSSLVPEFDRTGNYSSTFYGFRMLIDSIAAFLGSEIGGYLLDHSRETNMCWLPWIVFFLIAAVCAVAIRFNGGIRIAEAKLMDSIAFREGARA